MNKASALLWKTPRRYFLCLAPLLLLLVSPRAIAGIQPSFILEDCAWHSTDIVVATEGAEIDGKLTILEVWKGGLRQGATISVPELAAFAPIGNRTLETISLNKPSNAPLYVTGSRMVLFLKKPPLPQKSWQPAASIFRTMDESVVWIERGLVYAFMQIDNPGPTVLMRYYKSTEQDIKETVLSIDAVQDRFLRATQNPDPMLRAQVLEPFLHSDNYFVRKDALDALSHCGTSALPVLRSMLRDETLAARHGEIVAVMGTVGGKSIGPELIELVASELAFWRKTGPSLQQGWWGGTGLRETDIDPLRNHCDTLYSALVALADMRYQGDIKTVSDLRDFWRSLPQLEDKSGLNEISDECDIILGQVTETHL